MQRHVTLKGVHPVSSTSSRLVLFSLYGATRETMYRQFFDVHPVGCNTFIVVPWSTKMVFFSYGHPSHDGNPWSSLVYFWPYENGLFPTYG